MFCYCNNKARITFLENKRITFYSEQRRETDETKKHDVRTNMVLLYITCLCEVSLLIQS